MLTARRTVFKPVWGCWATLVDQKKKWKHLAINCEWLKLLGCQRGSGHWWCERVLRLRLSWEAAHCHLWAVGRKGWEQMRSIFFSHGILVESGKQKEGERPLQGIIKAVYIPFSVVNNGNCIYLRAQLFFPVTQSLIPVFMPVINVNVLFRLARFWYFLLLKYDQKFTVL